MSAELLTERFSDYDQVLYEWNDSLNMNLAMVGTYFGEHARDLLKQAYETYQLSVFMTQLRGGAVGRRALRPLDPPRLEPHG